jgi:hypothetical protein
MVSSMDYLRPTLYNDCMLQFGNMAYTRVDSCTRFFCTYLSRGSAFLSHSILAYLDLLDTRVIADTAKRTNAGYVDPGKWKENQVP